MIRQVALVAAGLMLVGCSSNGALDIGNKQDAAKYAAYAAEAKMPTTAPSKDAEVAALISGGALKIYNFSNNSMDNASVWINNQYVTMVGQIPANSVTSVDFSHFYDKAGMELDSDKTEVKMVSVESGNGVHSLWGPMIQQ